MADRKLFIGNLVRRITQDDLWVMYSTFGPLEECAKFHESFGFVRFLHAEDARNALNATHGITLKGRCIKVEFAATTTSWRSANQTCCNECRPPVRYNIPPIRAADVSNHRGNHHPINNVTSSAVTPPSIGPIGNRRKVQTKSTTCESNCSTGKSHRSSQSCSSPPSSYAASSSHVAEVDDYDCDLDSGYNDEFDSPLLSTSTNAAPVSAWYDLPMTEGIFIWDFQLYADIARELPLINHDNFVNDDAGPDMDWLLLMDLNQYL